MAEYLPVRIPGQALPMTAGATITGGQLVAVSGVNTVSPTTASTAKYLGVAAFDAATGDLLTVHCGGTQELTAAGAVTAGDLVVAAAAGKVASNATPAAGELVGIALTTAAAAGTVRVQFVR